MRKIIVLITLALSITACAPPPAVKSSMKVERVDAFPECLVVETPAVALRETQSFKDEKKRRAYEAELRVTKLYLAERLMATLRTETDAFPITRLDKNCNAGMRLSSVIRAFEPPGMLIGSISMQFEVDFLLKDSSNQKRAEITLAHGRGRNGLAMAAGMAGAPVGGTETLTEAADQFAESLAKRLSPALHLEESNKTNKR